MCLFQKKELGIYIVMKDENSRETFVEKLDSFEYEQNQLKYSKFSRFDNEKAAVKDAKNCMKKIPGWTFSKARCKL